MNKLFRWLTTMAVVLSFVGCVAATPVPDAVPDPAPAVETFKIDIKNESTAIAVFLVCVIPIDGKECIVSNLAIYPKIVVEDTKGDMPGCITIYLPAGDYVFAFVLFDVLTEQREQNYSVFTVTGDGELTFTDKMLDARND